MRTLWSKCIFLSEKFIILFIDDDMPLQDYEDVDSIKIPGGIYFTTLYSGHEEGVIDHIKDTKKELERGL